ncbi:lantibiotic protection ABC transporter ATP-binding protein [Marinilactibacillus kalidii]|uniref:lantibiotic protection ABC transporter ATP-binding protein n=1 Tax=Marinilactibacillus kalidii TaxID=2820274 RepID=UPI001ABDA8A7|nr:lantibiotic protection ABC transporter ATP-binding protein [Marinilactibacillus kalidii]
MAQNMIETKQLTKKFGKESVLKEIDIHVRRASVYGLLGANGAGKSTLLKVLTGILKPTSGEIWVDGKRWDRNQVASVGSMIEGPAIYPNLSAHDNLKVLSLLLDLPEKRIEKVLEIVGLVNVGKKRAGQFSLGMKQRLGIAMALINEPEVLILDEPTNGLDPLGIQELRELIRSFPERGITVILSSHLLTEVQLVADDIGIIHEGVMGFEGKNDRNAHDLETIFMKIVQQNRAEVSR